MNALFAPGAKCTRILVALGLTLLIAAPAVLLWAQRAQRVEGPEGGDGQFVDTIAAQIEGRRYESVQLPGSTLPPPEFAPFGRAMTVRLLPAELAKDSILTPLGHRKP